VIESAPIRATDTVRPRGGGKSTPLGVPRPWGGLYGDYREFGGFG
jgi:hypothetical protein